MGVERRDRGNRETHRAVVERWTSQEGNLLMLDLHSELYWEKQARGCVCMCVYKVIQCVYARTEQGTGC